MLKIPICQWFDGGSSLGRYKVHRLNLKMMTNPQTLEDFPNGLRGEVVATIPNVNQ